MIDQEKAAGAHPSTWANHSMSEAAKTEEAGSDDAEPNRRAR